MWKIYSTVVNDCVYATTAKTNFFKKTSEELNIKMSPEVCKTLASATIEDMLVFVNLH